MLEVIINRQFSNGVMLSDVQVMIVTCLKLFINLKAKFIAVLLHFTTMSN